MKSALWVFDTGAGEPAFNMAFDEALLATADARGTAVLRFYGWTESAATFGYFQRFADVERETLLRPLLRRPTGGGIVPHDRDWTYSLAVPPSHAWYALAAIESYRTMHAWLVAAFTRLGVATELADCCRKEVPGQCFKGWEKFDVLWGGRKIAGAAQRRNRLGLLIQGSVQPPPRLERGAWMAAMREARPTGFFDAVEEREPAADLFERTTEFRAIRYDRPDYHAAR